MTYEDKNLRKKDFMRQEPGPQPDPALSLSSGRSSNAAKWIVGLFAALVVAFLLFGLSMNETTAPIQAGMERSAQSMPPVSANPLPPASGVANPGVAGQAPPRVDPGAPVDQRGRAR